MGLQVEVEREGMTHTGVDHETCEISKVTSNYQRSRLTGLQVSRLVAITLLHSKESHRVSFGADDERDLIVS